MAAGLRACPVFKLATGRGSRVHWMMYLVSAVCVVDFTLDRIRRGFGW